MKRFDDLSPELRQLISAACDGTATPAQIAELEQHCGSDSALLRIYFDYCQLVADLHLIQASNFLANTALAQISLSESPVPSTLGHRWQRRWDRVRRFFLHPTPLSMTVSAIILGILITSLGLIFIPYRNIQSPSEASPVFVAKVTAAENAVWAKSSISMDVNSHLQLGHEFHLQQGTAELTFRDGAAVILEAPATGKLLGTGAIELERGKIVAVVPPRAVGFVVETKRARVVDLGTEFGVAVHDDQRVEVQVFAGKVEAFARGDLEKPGAKLKLVAGQSAHLASEQLVWTQSKKLSPTTFVRMIRRPNLSGKGEFGEFSYSGHLHNGFPEFLKPSLVNASTRAWNLGGDDQVINGVTLQGTITSGEGFVISPTAVRFRGTALNWQQDSQLEDKNAVSNTGLYSKAPASLTFQIAAKRGARHRLQLLSASAGLGERLFDVFVNGRQVARDLLVPNTAPWTVVYTVEVSADADELLLELKPGSQADRNPYVSAIAVTELDTPTTNLPK